MTKELLTVAERIKSLREKLELTQAEIARQLGISRAGVNAWEMGLAVPSTQYVVELAKMFGGLHRLSVGNGHNRRGLGGRAVRKTGGGGGERDRVFPCRKIKEPSPDQRSGDGSF